MVGTPLADGVIRFWVQDKAPIEPSMQAVLFTEFTRLHQVQAEVMGWGSPLSSALWTSWWRSGR
ncbi:MAG: hypothetical protein R2911_13380 [Caldilineaceae bacterium]